MQKTELRQAQNSNKVELLEPQRLETEKSQHGFCGQQKTRRSGFWVGGVIGVSAGSRSSQAPLPAASQKSTLESAVTL